MNLTTVTLSDKGQISIPVDLRRALGLKKGEKLVLIEEKGRIILETASKVVRKLAMLQHGESFATMMASEKTLGKEWDSEEDERWNAL
ncbi:AbrB/MazE/SpoVT family DNA-binding domain-containing protein [Candidatus Micrarchaeota archaeon]|nr:AbrB/MazE/SpoVT family DNA-binding domain-containing protein [Candidatus Micrarchaeota archaeon]